MVDMVRTVAGVHKRAAFMQHRQQRLSHQLAPVGTCTCNLIIMVRLYYTTIEEMAVYKIEATANTRTAHTKPSELVQDVMYSIEP